MTTADTDEDDNQELDDAQDDQSADVQPKSDEDSLDQRLPEDAEPADDDKDGSDEVQDPLLLAQMDDEPKAKAEQPPTGDVPPKPKAQPPKAEQPKAKAEKPKPKAEAADNPTPDDDHQAAEADLKAATERLPAEDWKNLSHTGKSKVLAMQRLARTSLAAAERAKAEADQKSSDYEQVEKLRERCGLEPQEFMQSVSLGGAIKAGRKEAIQFLEQTLDALRKHHGIEAPRAEAEVRVETFGIDPDELAKLADAAENFDLEAMAKLKRLAAQAKEAKGKLSQQPPKPTAAQPPAKSDDRQKPKQESSEESEFVAIGDALEGLGVAPEQMEAHVAQLIKDITGGDSKKLPPPGKRLRALVEAHHRRVQAAKPPPATRPPVTPPPLSGRTGTRAQVAGSNPTTPVDPLKIAFRS